MKQIETSQDPTAALDAYFEEFIRQSPALASIELATFSGNAADVLDKEGQVYLRLAASQRTDNDGKPYELVARLAAVSGLWNIPASPSEFLVLIPRDLDSVPGAAWAIWMGSAPSKLDQDKSFLTTAAKMAVSAAGYLLKTPGLTFGLDDGKLTIAWPNGTRIEGDSAGFRFVVVDSVGVATAMVLDAAGIKMALAPLGVPSVTWSLDGATGSVVTGGKGVYTVKFPFGFLGAAALPATGVGYGLGTASLQSSTWYVQP